jgi:hypothetical protein
MAFQKVRDWLENRLSATFVKVPMWNLDAFTANYSMKSSGYRGSTDLESERVVDGALPGPNPLRA